MRSGRVEGLVIGLVVDVDDPEAQGRVRVRFPWLDDALETVWVPVSGPLAGPDRGLFFMPNVGDELVVGFLHGDFNRAVVLGSLWNGQAPAPSADPRQRMIRSANGHTIRFVDSTPTGGDFGALVVEDRHGNHVTMSNGLLTVRATAVLQLEAPIIVMKGPGWRRVVTPSLNPI